MGTGQIDQYGNSVVVHKGMPLRNLSFDVSQSGGRRQHADVLPAGFKTQTEIMVVAFPVQKLQHLHDDGLILDRSVQKIPEKLFNIISHIQMKQAVVPHGLENLFCQMGD